MTRPIGNSKTVEYAYQDSEGKWQWYSRGLDVANLNKLVDKVRHQQDVRFVRAWQTSNNLKEVANKLNYEILNTALAALAYISQGVKLKVFPC